MNLGIWETIPKPESTTEKVVLIATLLLAVSAATVVARSFDLGVLAAAFLIPSVVAVHFWGLKKAVPVLIAVPILNELIQLFENIVDHEELFADPQLGGHLTGSLIVALTTMAYSVALNTSRSLKQELKLRKASESRESIRATQQSILARMSREIGSIEHPARVKRQIASSIRQLAASDRVFLYEKIEKIGGWVEVAQSGPHISTQEASVPNSVAFDDFTEIDRITSPTWIESEIGLVITASAAASTNTSSRFMIVPVLWRNKTIAFATLVYTDADEPDEQQLFLLQQATWQIAGSLAGSMVYQDVVELAFRLEKEASARDRMASVVSHEMRTPLTAAVAMNDILLRNRDENLTERQVEQLIVIRRNLQRIIAVSDDLLESSRMRSGGFELFSKHANLLQIIDDAVENFRPVAEGLGQNIHMELPEDTIFVHADISRLSQVVTNLLSNASKFSRTGRSIQVNFTVNDVTARVEVVDHGSGITPDQIQNVFDWAFQSDQQQSTGKHGAGIGLFVSKAIIDAHGGKIGIESIPDDQTTAWFEIPITTSHQPTPQPVTVSGIQHSTP